MLAHAGCGSLLGVEMVLTGTASQDLAVLGDLKTLGVRLICFNHDVFDIGNWRFDIREAHF